MQIQLFTIPAFDTGLSVESALTATPDAFAVQQTRILPSGLVERCIHGRAQNVSEGN